MTATEELVESSATISDDGVYRYDLVRRWAHGPLALWVMLNPSVADADRGDHTLTICTKISQREGCAGLALVNLYALRATDPTELADHVDPVGPDNVAHLERWLAEPPDVVSHVIVAWGDSIPGNKPHPQVLLLADRANQPTYCLGTTRKGRPRHPSRLALDTPLELYR